MQEKGAIEQFFNNIDHKKELLSGVNDFVENYNYFFHPYIYSDLIEKRSLHNMYGSIIHDRNIKNEIEKGTYLYALKLEIDHDLIENVLLHSNIDPTCIEKVQVSFFKHKNENFFAFSIFYTDANGYEHDLTEIYNTDKNTFLPEKKFNNIQSALYTTEFALFALEIIKKIEPYFHNIMNEEIFNQLDDNFREHLEKEIKNNTCFSQESIDILKLKYDSYRYVDTPIKNTENIEKTQERLLLEYNYLNESQSKMKAYEKKLLNEMNDISKTDLKNTNRAI